MKTRFVRIAIVLLVAVSAAIAQAPQTTDTRPEFEVATIKPNTSGGHMVRFYPPSPNRFSAENVTLQLLVQFAWNVAEFQVAGGPGWAGTDRYDIAATTASKSDIPEMRIMMQKLLEDRFQLKFHRETKDVPIYTLVQAKGGVKIQAASEGSCIPRGTIPAPPMPTPGQAMPKICGTMMMSPRSLMGTSLSMDQLTGSLSNILQRRVVNQSGLAGTYDFNIQWSADQNTMGPMPPGMPMPEMASDPNRGSIFTVLQEQLGLKLESGKGPVEVMMIDQAQKPGEN